MVAADRHTGVGVGVILETGCLRRPIWGTKLNSGDMQGGKVLGIVLRQQMEELVHT